MICSHFVADLAERQLSSKIKRDPVDKVLLHSQSIMLKNIKSALQPS